MSSAAFAGHSHFPFKNGLRPLTPEQENYLKDKVVQIQAIKPNKIALARSASSPSPPAGPPAAVSNWQNLPKVGSQGGLGSCTAWSTCYYYKTYQEAREHGWGRPDPGADPEHVMSPAFCYNLVNGGGDDGSMPVWIMQMIAEHGNAAWRDMPYDDTDCTTWPSEAAWKNALPYRAQSVASIDTTNDAGIRLLKQQLANGDLAVITFSFMENFVTYPDTCAGIDSQVIYDNSGYIDGGHAVTVIGYDDNKSYVDGGGVTRYGAFKIVNSWGSDWGILDPDAGTKGFVWMAYTYLRDKTDGQALTMVDRTGYQPTVYGTFGLAHPSRGDLSVYFMGGNDRDNPDWSFNALPYMGGTQPVGQKIVADLSSFAPDLNGNFWLKVYDSLAGPATGQITYMSVQAAGGSEKISQDTPKNTRNGNYVYVRLANAGPGGDTALDPSFTQDNPTSLTAAWNPVPGAEFVVVLSSDSLFTGILSSGSWGQNSKTFTGLSAGTRYYFQVKLSTEPDTAYMYNRASESTPEGTWSVAGSLAAARSNSAAAVLPDGRVLAAGGSGEGGDELSSVEVYDPAANVWSGAGSMSVQRVSHAVALLPDGRVLATGGSSKWEPLSSAEIYDPGTNGWSGAASMSVPRKSQTATPLPDGRVLVAGGSGSGGALLSSAELYDPRTNTWAPAGVMSAARAYHTATLLPDGRVLVAGGGNREPISSAELYDPKTNTWSGAGTMLFVRGSPAAALLPNGKVLVAGGYGGGVSAEIYDPGTNTWSRAGDLLSGGREAVAAVSLPDGKVLVAGGYATGGAAETYDPETNIWSSAGSMSRERYYYLAALLPGGKVLMAGGYGGGSSAELFSPAGLALTGLNPSFTQVGFSEISAAWTALPGALYDVGLYSDAGFMAPVSSAVQNANTAAFTGLSPATRYFFQVKLSTEAGWAYAGSRLAATTPSPAALAWTGEPEYVSGGLAPAIGPSGTSFSYRVKYTNANGKEPASGYPKLHIRKGGTEIAGSPFAMAYLSGSLGTGELYGYSRSLMDGLDYSYYFEAYDSDNNGVTGPPVSVRNAPNVCAGVWTAASSMLSPRSGAAAALLTGGRVLMVGGAGGSAPSAELYDPNTNSWSAAAPMLHDSNTAVQLAGGKVLMVGGFGPDFLSSKLYDPEADSWSGAGTMPGPRYNSPVTLLPDGRVLMAGGFSGDDYLSSAQLYDPETNGWSAAGAMASGRHNHAAVLLPNGKVLVAGGSNGSGYVASAELYDPKTNSWSDAGSMSSARENPIAAALPGGKVLVAGGAGGGSSADIYDQGTNSWTAARAMTQERDHPAAVPLPDGRVLVAGGNSNTDPYSAEIYDPATDFWAAAGAKSSVRYAPAAALLPDGRVLVAGGYKYGSQGLDSLSSSDLFVPFGLALTKLEPVIAQVVFSSFTVTWTLVQGANYTVVLSTDANFMSVNSSTTQSGNSATFTGLPDGKRYFFEVKLSTEAEWAYARNRAAAVIQNTTALIRPGGGYTLVYDRISLAIPPDAFNENTAVLIKRPALPPPDSGGLAGFSSRVLAEISAQNPAAQKLQPLKEVTLAADYRNVDLGDADEDALVIATYDESHSAWVPLPSARDKSSKTVTARTGHFSMFQLMRSFAPESVSGITVGPNPLRPVKDPGARFTFRHLPSGASVKIYTSLGELLCETETDASGMAVWDGKNRAGRPVASDIYLALIKWKGEKKILKLVVEK